jgi:hypothetical protein
LTRGSVPDYTLLAKGGVELRPGIDLGECTRSSHISRQ